MGQLAESFTGARVVPFAQTQGELVANGEVGVIDQLQHRRAQVRGFQGSLAQANRLPPYRRMGIMKGGFEQIGRDALQTLERAERLQAD